MPPRTDQEGQAWGCGASLWGLRRQRRGWNRTFLGAPSPKEGDGQPASRTPARPAGVQSCQGLSRGFPGGSDGRESACNTGDPGLIPGSGRSLGEGNSYTLQYSCLESPMCRGAGRAIDHE